MARLPRLDLPGIPQHLVQRGNNRLPCFGDDVDRQKYLQFLLRASHDEGCDIHAYVLMGNHVHLLCTPKAECAASKMMQALGRRYVMFFNARHARTGTLWEGRFKANLVDTDQYLLACYRYIEMNPVRAGIVSSPDQYAWSSFACNALGRHDGLLTPHAGYLALGTDKIVRQTAYRALFRHSQQDAVVDEIRINLQQQRALGSEAFRRRIEAETQRIAHVRPAHRPRKSRDSEARLEVGSDPLY